MRERPATAPRRLPEGTGWFVLGVLVLQVAACVVDTEVPEDALLTCLDDSHCPAQWTCDPASALCLPPGGASPVEPELAEARLAFCEALFDAAQPCQEELTETLGEEAQVFLLPRPTFLHMCTTSMLADTTMEDVDELHLGAAYIPLLSCEELADFLYEELLSDEEEN